MESKSPSTNGKPDARIAYIPDIHGHAKGEHKAFAEERPIPYTARMLFLWFFHACRRSSPRFLMVADHMNYLTFEDPAAVNLVRRALKLAQAGDLYGAAETAGVELGHAAVVSEGLKRGMRYSIGAEIDNDPRCRPDAQNIVDAMKPDGMIRSIHFLPITHPQHGENWMWAFDNPEFKDLYDVVGPATVWEIYIATLLDAIEKLPGNIVGHFYVPAKFGHWPEDDVLEAYEDRFVAACAERGMAIEINSRYFYKYYLDDDAQRERYRSAHLRLLAKAKAANVMIAVGSDAHSPKDQGNAFETVLELLDEADINEIAFPIGGRLARVALRATEEVLRQHSAALAPPVVERPAPKAADLEAEPERATTEPATAEPAAAEVEAVPSAAVEKKKAAPRPSRARPKAAAPAQGAQADAAIEAEAEAVAATVPASGAAPVHASAPNTEQSTAEASATAPFAEPTKASATAPIDEPTEAALPVKKRSHKKRPPIESARATIGALADAVVSVATKAVEAFTVALAPHEGPASEPAPEPALETVSETPVVPAQSEPIHAAAEPDAATALPERAPSIAEAAPVAAKGAATKSGRAHVEPAKPEPASSEPAKPKPAKPALTKGATLKAAPPTKMPVAKAPPAKAPTAKAPPAKAPTAKTPPAKAPSAKAPPAKTLPAKAVAAKAPAVKATSASKPAAKTVKPVKPAAKPSTKAASAAKPTRPKATPAQKAPAKKTVTKAPARATTAKKSAAKPAARPAAKKTVAKPVARAKKPPAKAPKRPAPVKSAPAKKSVAKKTVAKKKSARARR